MKVFIGPYVDHPEVRQEDVTIDKWDTWNLDHTLSLIIVPCLIQLKETTNGAPLVSDADVPEHLRSTAAPPKENVWDVDDNHFKRWDWVLDEMIWAFSEHATGDDDSKFYDHSKVDESADFNTQISQIKHDSEAHMRHDERKRRAFMLFGKYYQNLWD